jgi:tRNA 5-methylaminomethyl-2-thiouridine biosynthesis bifunctional protein
MSEPVEWLPDGTPRSPRFGDIYRTSTGGLEQARHVFLGGCDLPAAWAGQPQWRILETGFGLGLNFLASWRAWKDDPQRPRLLHFVSMDAWSVSAADLRRSAAPHPQLAPLADALAEQWFGLVPGMHRLVFEEGHVLLTLFAGDVKNALAQEPFPADAVFLDGFDPQRNPAMWELAAFKAIARHCRRGTRVATWTVAGEVRRQLEQCGFILEKTEGLAPKRHCLKGVFDPGWEPKGRRLQAGVVPAVCAVVGSGLAGAAAAASLARRGWQVTVFDAGDAPAAGASSLPVGLLAPHFSVDDNLLSRLTRSGVRATLQQARALLSHGLDWQWSGVLEHRPDPPPAFQRRIAAMPLEDAWTCPAGSGQRAAAFLGPDATALWHPQGGWIKPAMLVQAWLAQPGITWRGSTQVDRAERCAGGWRLADARDGTVAEADLVVLAAGTATSQLACHALPLQSVRGQVSWAEQDAQQKLPPFPVNGNGHFIPGVPVGAATAWFCGATYGRGETDLLPRRADHQENLTRLGALLPSVEQQLVSSFSSRSLRAWTGVRCASADRRPLIGELEPGLWVSTAMGSRGLTFAALCAELLAARLHGEPLPLERRLAAALDAARGRPQRPASH